MAPICFENYRWRSPLRSRTRAIGECDQASIKTKSIGSCDSRRDRGITTSRAGSSGCCPDGVRASFFRSEGIGARVGLIAPNRPHW